MKIVISGVNLVEGGPLKVFKDVVIAFSSSEDFNVVCLVHDVSLFTDFEGYNVQLLEFPSIKKSWLKRCWFEYVSCIGISRELSPDIWLAMHDMTPNVISPIQFVYCHNPAPFYTASCKELEYEPKLFFFSLLYKWLYRIKIKDNRAVITQQQWIGEYLVNVLGANRYIVAKPISSRLHPRKVVDKFSDLEVVNFFFPALARTFKNFELILDALVYLKVHDQVTYQAVNVVLTIDEFSGRYALSLLKKYQGLERVQFLGTIDYEDVIEQYKKCDIVLFPSRLETWGLPISEAKEFSKPIILADLPYAHETLGSYSSALFVDPDDHYNLAMKMVDIVAGRLVFESVSYDDGSAVVSSWEHLVEKIKTIADGN